jgi:hypothetical protein
MIENLSTEVVIAGVDALCEYHYRYPTVGGMNCEVIDIVSIMVRLPTDDPQEVEYIDLAGIINEATRNDIENQISWTMNDMLETDQEGNTYSIVAHVRSEP